jgi:hypothetical protein
MTEWNQNNPATSGLEWFPTRKLPKALSSASLLGVKMQASASESIASIHPRIASEEAVPFGVDVYDLANPLYDYVRPVLGMPVGCRENAAGWKRYISSVEYAYDSSAYQCVDDPGSLNFGNSIGASDSLLYLNGLNDNGHVMFNTTWADGFIDANTGDPGFTVDGKRTLSVDVVCIVENVASFGGVRFDGQLAMGGTRYGSQSGSILIPAGQGLTRCVFTFNRNPSTGVQWTDNDVDDIVTQVHGFGLRILDKPQAGYFLVTVLNLQFKITEERRVCAGYGFAPASGGAWCPVTCTAPADTTVPAAWSKVSGHVYLFLFYSIYGNESLVGVDSANLSGHSSDELPGWEGAAVSSQLFAPTATPTYSPWVPGLFMKKVNTAISVDCQPYVTPVAVPIVNGSNDGQTIPAHATADYGSVTVAVSRVDQPTQPLTLRLHQTSNNAQVGGDAVIDVSDVPNDGQLHVVTVTFGTNASLAAGTSYYIKPTTTSSAAWRMAACYTGAEVGATADDNFAETGSISGGAVRDGASAAMDWLTRISTAPSAPGSGSVGLGTITPSPSPPGGPDTVRYAILDWASTALGGAFAYYEVQRQDAGAWNAIALITIESSSFFNDVEAPRGVSSSYRVRSLRTDGAPSSWRTLGSVTVPASGGKCDVILTSNAAPQYTRAYQDESPHTYGRANTPQYVTQLIAGRQAPMAFRPLLEGNADVFQRTFLVAMDETLTPLTTIDRSLFTPLVSLIEAPSPYTRVIQGNGDSWYASGKIINFAFSQPGNAHKCTIEFTEVSFIPAAIVVGTPWSP